MHSNIVPNRIWTSEESVYRDSPTGKTEASYLVGRTPSLQQGFCGYSQTGLPVTVHDKAALASEQRIVGSIMAFSHSTAVGAPLARVPAINDIQYNTFVKAPLLKVPSECIEGNSHHLTVEALSLGAKPFQVLNGDVSIILECKVGDVSNDFANPVPHEIVFSLLRSIQLLLSRRIASICIGLQETLTLKYFLTLCPNILTKICLLQHLSFWRQNSQSEAFAVHINSKKVLSSRHTILIGKICHNLQVGSQTKGLTRPAASEKAAEPIPVPIFSDWNGESVSGVETQLGKQEGLSREHLTVPRDVELHGYTINTLTSCLLSPSASSKVADNLNVEPSESLGFRTNIMPEIVEPLVLAPFGKKSVNFSSSRLFKCGKNPLFGRCGFSLKKNSPLHSPNREKSSLEYYSSVSPQFLPPLKGVGFLGGFR